MAYRVAIYTRVSTPDQDPSRQIHELTQHATSQGWEVVATIQETASGSTRSRQGITELLQLARSGKIGKVLVSEVSRLGRQTSEVLQVVEQLTRDRVSVLVLNYHLETLTREGKPNPTAQIMFTLLAEFARLERETMIERIKSGIEQAKRKGKAVGRPAGTRQTMQATLERYPQAARLLKKGHSLRDVAALAGISVNTVRKVKTAMEKTH